MEFEPSKGAKTLEATLLIAASDEDLCGVSKRNLEEAGYEVVCAVDGKEARQQLHLTEFDLVITDVRMPGVQGIELVELIKQATPDTEVVIATSNTDIDMALQFLREGAFDFIQKPLNPIDPRVIV